MIAGNYIHAIALHTNPFLILYLIWVLIFYIFGLYDLVTIKPTIPYLKRWVWAIVTSFIVGLLALLRPYIWNLSEGKPAYPSGTLGLFSFSLRRMMYSIFANTLTHFPTVIIGESTYLLELKGIIEKNPQIGLQIVSYAKNIEELDKEKVNDKGTIIIIDKNGTSDDKVLELYKDGVEIIDTAKAYEKYLFKIPVNYIDASFVSDNINAHKDIMYTIITFVVDKIFAVAVLILSSLLLC